MSKLFLDSKVIVAILMQADPHHQAVREWLKKQVPGNELYVSPQVIAETYATITSPTKFKHPLSPRQAKSGLIQFVGAKEVKLVPIGFIALEQALEASVKLNKRARQFFDLLIWGTMKEHQIKILATFNIRDFQNLPEIKPLAPE